MAVREYTAHKQKIDIHNDAKGCWTESITVSNLRTFQYDPRRFLFIPTFTLVVVYPLMYSPTFFFADFLFFFFTPLLFPQVSNRVQGYNMAKCPQWMTTHCLGNWGSAVEQFLELCISHIKFAKLSIILSWMIFSLCTRIYCKWCSRDDGMSCLTHIFCFLIFWELKSKKKKKKTCQVITLKYDFKISSKV